MRIEVMFPDAVWDKVENDRDNPCTGASFYVPKGYWYSTDDDARARFADEDLSVYMSDGYLKIVNPSKSPPKGTWYYWV